MKRYLILLPIALLTACASTKNDNFLDSLAQDPSTELLTSTDWIVISGHSFNENDVKTNLDDLLPASGERALVSFDNSGQIKIRGGCSDFIGHWSLENNQIKISPLGGTETTACDNNTYLTNLDKAIRSLFADKTIIARVPNGIDNSLIRMQTEDNIYYVMQASNKIANNNKSYAGKYFSDDVFRQYRWRLINAHDKAGNTLLSNSPIQITTFNQEGENLVVKSSCGEINFNVKFNQNDLTVEETTSGTEQCEKVSRVLANQHFKLTGEMIGKRPEIKLLGDDGGVIVLKGTKK